MKNYYKVTYLIILLIISSCTAYRTKKYLKEGEVVQKNFKTVIPFEIKNGFMILKVKIKSKIYNFILDTGATNVVSKELAEELELKLLGSSKVYDVFSDFQILQYGRLDNIKIGDLDFKETITLVNNFNKIPFISCLEIDGFIGSNLMQHAVWDFDFAKKTITITDNESKLNLPQNVIDNKLFIGYGGVPSIMTKVNDKKIWNFMVDFGFDGSITMPFSEFKDQKEKGIIKNFAKSKTLGVTGVYGQQSNVKEAYIGVVDKINFGNTVLNNEEVMTEKSLTKVFGLGFFKDYRVILNWNAKKIKMIPQKNKIDDNFESFGFSYSLKNNCLIIGTLYDNTKAESYLQIGDQILSVNGKDYSIVSNEDYCSIMNEGILNDNNGVIKIKVLRGSEKLIFSLKKEKLLNLK